MSTVFGLHSGQIQSVNPPVLLTTTAITVLLTATINNGGGSGLDIIGVCFAVGTASNITLQAFDGATAYNLLPAALVAPANLPYIWEFPYTLPFGWSLRASASNANQVTVNVAYSATPKAPP